MEISPLIYSANQWTGFYMIGASVIKELNQQQQVIRDCLQISLLILRLLYYYINITY